MYHSRESYKAGLEDYGGDLDDCRGSYMGDPDDCRMSYRDLIWMTVEDLVEC